MLEKGIKGTGRQVVTEKLSVLKLNIALEENK